MAKPTFDENGDTFNYFLLVTLLIVLIPSTYVTLKANTAQYFYIENNTLVVTLNRATCHCDACQRKASRIHATRKATGASTKKILGLVAGWVLLAFVAYQVHITPSPEVIRWNPFDVLGIKDSATPKEIKSAYRGLSRVWHPDKVSIEQREEAESKMTEINKAYETLTDDDTRENWEKYGHPDGSRDQMKMSIALPAWLIEAHNNFWVLAAYGLVCGLMLPYFIGKWWYRSGNYTKDKIRTATMGLFFKQLKETMSPKEIVEILSKAVEFKDELVTRSSDAAALKHLGALVGAALEQRNGEHFDYNQDSMPLHQLKVLTLLYAHTLNVPVEDKDLAQDQADITAKTLHLIHGMIQLTTARQWLSVSLTLMDMSQLLVQGLYFHDSPLQQLPFIDPVAAKAQKGNSQGAVKSITQFMELDRKDRQALLLPNTTTEQEDQIPAVAKQYPRFEAQKAFFKVAGDSIITPGSLCTFILKARAVAPGDTIEDDDEEDKKKKTTKKSAEDKAKEEVEALFEPLGDIDSEEDEVGNIKSRAKPKSKAPVVHSPNFPGDKSPYWWVVLGDPKNNRIVVQPTKIADVTTESRKVRVQFQAPPRPGSYTFNMYIKSDSLLGSDIVRELTLTVHDASDLPEEEDVDDDISEPDEDSIAGQMALLKEQGFAAAALGGGAAAGGKGAPAPAAGKGKGKAPQTDSDSDDD
ncbi:secretory subunit [Actinomortierella ambigua]|nr:secretory subunit [Actinomortierella ambigua]